MTVKNYSSTASTLFTSGTILFNKPSIPAFNVILEEGQPLEQIFETEKGADPLAERILVQDKAIAAGHEEIRFVGRYHSGCGVLACA
jgi:hypothetical protein